MKGAGIIFTDGNKLLLLRKNKAFEIPGGKAKKSENPLETAERECKEEIGCCPGVRFAHHDERDYFRVYLYRVYKPFAVKLSNEHTGYEWVAWKDLDQCRLHPMFVENLPHYLKLVKKEFTSSFREWFD